MKPSVISGATAADSNGRSTATNNSAGSSNGMNIPVNHQYGGPQQQSTFANDPNIPPGYNSPSNGRQFPHHFQQNFGFDPDIDSMFQDTGIRSRLGRMQDPFGTFGSRKRCGNEPQASKYFDDDPDFFPHFGTLGNRRRAGGNTGGSAAGGVGGAGIPTMDPAADGDDFFDRLPPEFRQYIPEGFGMAHRRSGSAGPQSPRTQQQYAPQYYPSYGGGQPEATSAAAAAAAAASAMSQSPKILRDAAIQTELSQQADAVDGGHQRQNLNHLNQHGLRNTFDMGDKLTAEEKNHGVRAQSAPPNEQPTVSPRASQHQNTPPPQYNNSNFSTQTSPQVVGSGDHPPNYQRYPTQNQSQQQQHQPTQQQQPSTPGGSNIRTIPIFVEGRSEPIINSHKEIPNQSQAASNTTPPPTASAAKTAYNNGAGGGGQQQQYHQQHRPTPLNTQQAAAATQDSQPQEPGNHPPQTPHTMDSINKIQDIQRDVLDLMSKVEKFAGKRQDKEYAYLDEMLTRNLLKLDTIDTNGKESIRMARKEAIKCIQASINVLEAKAEENAKAAAAAATADATGSGSNPNSKSSSSNEVTAQLATHESHEAIPLPPPNATATNPTNPKEPSPAKDAGQKYVQKETVVDAKTE